MASFTRDQYVYVYEFVKRIAKEAQTPEKFLRAQIIANMVEAAVGQLSPVPATEWKLRNIQGE